jgi:hypothetical protein
MKIKVECHAGHRGERDEPRADSVEGDEIPPR